MRFLIALGMMFVALVLRLDGMMLGVMGIAMLYALAIDILEVMSWK